MYDLKKLEKWMERQITTPREGDKLKAFALVHNTTAGSDELELIAVPPKADESFITTAIELFHESVTVQSDATPGVQEFAVLAIYNVREPFFFKFRHVNTKNKESIGGATEPANATGIMQMLMRHTEAKERMLLGTIEALMERFENTIRSQGETIDSLLEDRIGSMKVIEELMSQRHTRELETKRENAKIEVMGELADRVMAILPIAVSKLLKKANGNNDTQMEDAKADALLASITTEQFEQLLSPSSGLKDEQKALLVNMLKDYKERKDKRSQQKQLKGKSKDTKEQPL